MRDTRLLKLLFVSVALAVAMFVYRPGLSGGFALDDYTNVVDNAALDMPDLGWQSLSHAMFSFQAGPTMRPVSMLSFALNRFFAGGNDAMSYKATNLAIHLVNGLLVFVLLLRLLDIFRQRIAPQLSKERLDWLALICGGLWILHPLNVMPVLYVVQRETALSATFILLGLNAYVWARQRHIDGRRGIWLLWTAVPSLTLVAVLSKESGALLPVYARTILDVGPVGLGILRTAPAVGALLAAGILTRRPLKQPSISTATVRAGSSFSRTAAPVASSPSGVTKQSTPGSGLPPR